MQNSRPGALTITRELLEKRLPRYTSYPTAPHFSPAVTGAVMADWLEALPSGQPLSLYVHVPFCRQLCWYCGCNMSVVNRQQPVEEYLQTLLREIELVAARLPGRRRVTHLHFGGGSPGILGADGLVRLVMALRHHFDLCGEIAIELDPRHVDRFLALQLADIGFNRVSLGVQDIDAKVQEAINRPQNFERVQAAAEAVRAAGISGLSVDLLYGLPHQTVESVLETTRRVLDLRPSRLAIFGYAHVPWMKKHQQLIDETALPDGMARFDQAEAMAAVLLAAGYRRIGIDHFALMTDELATNPVGRNFQGYTTDQAEALIGIGVSSISALPQGYAQNSPDVPEWRRRVEAGELSVVKGFALTAEDRQRRTVIERLMCDLSVDLDVCAGTAWLQWHEAIAEVDRLTREGICLRAGGRIWVPERGRPFVRHVAAAFDAYLVPATGRHAAAV